MLSLISKTFVQKMAVPVRFSSSYSAIKGLLDMETPFQFSSSNVARVNLIKKHFPSNKQQSAIIPVLDLAQRQCGWTPASAIAETARILSVPEVQVYEAATFYTMFHKRPRGRLSVEVCTNPSCMIRGSDDIMKTVEHALGVRNGETTEDLKISLNEVECQGACVNAPMMIINGIYYEDLDVEKTKEIVGSYKRNTIPLGGPQISRKSSEPISGKTTLKEPPMGPYAPMFD
eukprot:TRINITY_DN995_c0_g1_i1.p1 TRINITY_DN995_c0_g1~~TRINITY_DN995_c0_g1_i1.p1  ORF type:complete len:231 (+),score=49.15 TRINITY_DN995_c0_g1_i1:69-761(+)